LRLFRHTRPHRVRRRCHCDRQAWWAIASHTIF
jgi:hypothetical protein